MPPVENCESSGITQIFSARARFGEALQHIKGTPGMQMAAHILGFRPRKFINRYETITHCGYRLETGELFARIAVQPDAASDGSPEFVRFYVDTGDGEWQDAGCISVMPAGNGAAPDAAIADDTAAMVEARMQWLPESLPVLINGPARMKAVLCWSVAPPANDPECLADFPYVWADTKETAIRLGQATRPRPVEKVGKLSSAGFGLPVTAPKNGTLLPAYRKIVKVKPAFSAAVRKTAGKKQYTAAAPIIPVYKSKSWSSAI